jgi:hypothetical protein
MGDSWSETLDGQMGQLELVATWASLVNYGEVRDAVREAIHMIRKRKEMHESLRATRAAFDARMKEQLA